MKKAFFTRRHWLVLLLFGLVGQIAWSVENMYFNLFVFETVAPDLDTVTLMVQLSGVAATVTTLVAGTFSDKCGNRRDRIPHLGRNGSDFRHDQHRAGGGAYGHRRGTGAGADPRYYRSCGLCDDRVWLYRQRRCL